MICKAINNAHIIKAVSFLFWFDDIEDHRCYKRKKTINQLFIYLEKGTDYIFSFDI